MTLIILKCIFNIIKEWIGNERGKYGCKFSANNNAAALRGGNRDSLVPCNKGNQKKIMILFERRNQEKLLHIIKKFI